MLFRTCKQKNYPSLVKLIIELTLKCLLSDRNKFIAEGPLPIDLDFYEIRVSINHLFMNTATKAFSRCNRLQTKRNQLYNIKLLRPHNIHTIVLLSKENQMR